MRLNAWHCNTELQAFVSTRVNNPWAHAEWRWQFSDRWVQRRAMSSSVYLFQLMSHLKCADNEQIKITTNKADWKKQNVSISPLELPSHAMALPGNTVNITGTSNGIPVVKVAIFPFLRKNTKATTRWPRQTNGCEWSRFTLWIGVLNKSCTMRQKKECPFKAIHC